MESVFSVVFFCRTLAVTVEAGAFDAGVFFVVENASWRLGFFTSPEVPGRKTLSGDKNGEAGVLSIPTWHC